MLVLEAMSLSACSSNWQHVSGGNPCSHWGMWIWSWSWVWRLILRLPGPVRSTMVSSASVHWRAVHTMAQQHTNSDMERGAGQQSWTAMYPYHPPVPHSVSIPPAFHPYLPCPAPPWALCWSKHYWVVKHASAGASQWSTAPPVIQHGDASHTGLSLVPRLPYPWGRGGACLPLSKWWVPPDGTPPPPCGGLGVGQERVGGFEGKGCIPGAKGELLPCIFSCVGQSVSAWVPLELSPPPPPVGVGQVLWGRNEKGSPPPPPPGLL